MTLAENPALERLLRRDRVITGVGLAMLALLAWLYLLTGAGLGMSPQAMTSFVLFPHRAAATAMPMSVPGPAGPAFAALTAAMWFTMMVAMMTPSAAPAILLYARVFRYSANNGRDGAANLAPTWAFAGGYLLVWLGFSLAAAVLQLMLQQAGLVSAHTLGSQSRWLSVGVLLAAGLYQLTPLARACLSHCRSPAEFLARHYKPGALGAVGLGVRHGARCVGCCWLLMTLLFVGGVMNLAWIAALSLLVLAEKLAPGGPWVSRISGGVLITWALATAVV